MSGRPLACLLTTIGLLAAQALPVRAAGRWAEIRSEHFVFISEASERQVRDLAMRLEQFREVVTRTLPPSALDSPVPTVVLVFRSSGSFTPYKPLFEGRPISVNGFFQAGDDVNYLAINVESERSALNTLFHEFAHLLSRNMEGELPVWVNEGLAGVYETFDVDRSGKSATFGLPNVERLNLLQQESMMPLEDLLAVERSSPDYNQSSKRRVFYAQSWALVHYLMFGKEARTAAFRGYLDDLRGGADPSAAFRKAFGADIEPLEKELREYVRHVTFPERRVTFSEKVARADAGRATPIDDAEAGAYLGDLLARMDRIDEAGQLLRTLVGSYPSSGRVASALGRVELARDDSEAARPHLERALTLTPDDEPNRLRLADVLVRGEEFERAVGYLEPLAANGRLPDTRLRAQDLLDYASARIARRLADALPRGGDLAPADSDAATVDSVSAADRFAADRTPGSRFRSVAPGEMRVLGTFVAVECRGPSPVIVIDAEDQSLHLETSGLANVQFIGYEGPAPTPVCGPVETPSRVFATYRDADVVAAGDSVDGRAVAIEWLPGDYSAR